MTRDAGRAWNRASLGPRIFIGSSSESLDVARTLSSLLSKAGFLPMLWNRGVFEAGETYIESLERATRESAFALLVVTPDDMIESRGQTQQAVRDNVLFELGFFMGALGRRRTLIVAQSDAVLRIPSDLSGISMISFQRFSQVSLLQALDAPALEIEQKIQRELSLLESSRIEITQLATPGSHGYTGSVRRPGALGTAVNGTRRAELFVVSSDGGLQHSWEKTQGGPIADWSRFGDGVHDGPSVFTVDGKVTVVYTNTAGQLCIRSQTGLSGSWGKWSRLGRTFRGPVSVSMTKAGPSIFAVRSGKTIIQTRRAADGEWSVSREIGRIHTAVQNIQTLLSSSARGEVLLRDDGGGLWHAKELEAEDNWAELVKLDGPPVRDASLAVDNEGLTALLTVGSGGELLFRRQRHVRGDLWGPLAEVPGDLRWSGLSMMSCPSGFLLLGASRSGTLQIASMTAEFSVIDSLKSDQEISSWTTCEGKDSTAYATDSTGHFMRIDAAALWPVSAP